MSKRTKERDSKRLKIKQASREPLPSSLSRLKKIFESLNVFCCFCNAKMTTSLTLHKLQSVVSDLQVEDLASINVIIPDFIHMNYLPENTLEVEFGSPCSKQSSRLKQIQASGNRGWYLTQNEKTIKTDVIKKHIDHQNKLFVDSLLKYLDCCHNMDPEDHLISERMKHIPVTNEPPLKVTPDQNTHPTMAAIIEGMKSQHFYHDQLKDTNRRIYPKKDPIYSNIDNIHPEIVSALSRRHITQLYIHQTEALKGLHNNQHIIVSTSTASGKSLIYQIPVIESLLDDSKNTAMYIFPTKALAQDQKRALEVMLHDIPQLESTFVSTFDGDVPSNQRAFIRDNANVIFTNPDMLHHSILPNSKLWESFLSSLKYIVIDELHVYSGLFGTHIAYIMRRLRRICDHIGNHDIKFISCSATIDNPDEHMKTLLGVDNVKVINEDGAPHGKKDFIIWNPPLLRPLDDHSERKSSIVETADIFIYLLENNVRTIAFCKVRKACELLMKQIRDILSKDQKKDILNRVMSYRGGYNAPDRRRIEGQLFNGELLGVIATNALELGIDIGSLDAVLMLGVPWSISALWQQSGRAGRRNTDSLSLVINDHNPMDQYYAKHPTVLFEKRPDKVSINLENSIILESHLQCAAEEHIIDADKDEIYFGPSIRSVCEDHLFKISNNLYRPNPLLRPYPSQYVSIRNVTDDYFAVVDVTDNKNSVIEEIEVYRAGFEIYEGAIFIHQGRPYLVEECNIDKRYARVHLTNVDWTTVQRDFTNVDVLSTSESKEIKSTKNFVCYGDVKVSTVVFGYFRIDKRKRIIDSHDVYMDPILTYSKGVWIDVPSASMRELEKDQIDPMAAIHAASHCLISILPRYSYSTVNDLKTECKNPNATRQRPFRIALYETQPCGVVKQAYKFVDTLLENCIQIIETCPCEDGCPSCVHLSQCSEHNELCSKKGALTILKCIVEINSR
ncbi:P-loop containing nucleoside triphosphate hydrolase protein [Pilobolus umbonatus]|nr:P-loop containing nucleoside triphosphate hydrolase protein [Pilobolus umbonatus]